MIDVAKYIDHTILKPTTLRSDIKQLCTEAAANKFAAVCVPPNLVRYASEELRNHDTKVSTVIGFPFGYSVGAAKATEIEHAIHDGADELDVVINISALKNDDTNTLADEMEQMLQVVRRSGRVIKVIIESGILTDKEIIHCCRLYAELGVDYLKTSTGYAEKGASVHAVQLMRANLPSGIKIKASGGIRSLDSALEYIREGADRIGTSSGVAILNQQSLLQK